MGQRRVLFCALRSPPHSMRRMLERSSGYDFLDPSRLRPQGLGSGRATSVLSFDRLTEARPDFAESRCLRLPVKQSGYAKIFWNP